MQSPTGASQRRLEARNCVCLCLLLCILACSTTLAYALSPTYPRHPALSPDGQHLAFDWRGDIWVVEAQGGTAQRLTAHLAHDYMPKWSPDGSAIAFSSDRHGNPDLFVLTLADGTLERLTFHSDADQVFGWGPAGEEIYFGSWRGARFQYLYCVPRSGGRPVRVIHDLCLDAQLSPDGRWIAYVRGYTNWWRKDYRGPASRDVWVRATEAGTSWKVTDSPGNDDWPCWSADGQSLYFASERDGVMNLFRQPLAVTVGESAAGLETETEPAVVAGGDPAALTHFDRDGIQYLEVSRDGRWATFEWDGGIYIVATAGGEPRRVAIDCPADTKQNQVSHETRTSGATEYAFAPGEEELAFIVEGEVYVARIVDDELRDPKRITETDARERDLAWLDEHTLLYASDRHGDDDIFLARSTDEDEPRLGRSRYREEVRLTDAPETERRPQVSPDGETILYTRGTRFLWTMEPDGDDQELLLDEPGILHSSWSPDSRYVAYSYTTLGYAEDIFILDTETGESVNVSNHPNDDFHPLWSGDGKRLSWASRTEEGLYHLKYLWLTWEEADKTEAQREREEEEEEEAREADDDDDEGEEDEDEEEVPEVRIDYGDYAERIHTVTTVRGYYWDYDASPDGEHYALRTDAIEEMELWTVDWKGERLRRMTYDGADPDEIRWSEDNERVRYISDGRIKDILDEEDATPHTYGFSAELTVDLDARRLQKFHEAWRLLNDGFYDPNFHGIDWQAVREKYEPLAAEAIMTEDWNDVVREMIGELNASHLGVYGGPHPGRGDDETGFLGFTPDDDYAGPGVRVAKILRRGPLDREGSRVEVGEVILAIDGEPIEAGMNPYPLLNHTVDEEIDLDVARDGRGRDRRTLTVVPISGWRAWRLTYEQWMDENRARIDELSGGRLGYVHMSAMGGGNWDAFIEDLFSEAYGRDGLVLDIRYNNGGSIHDQVLTFLSRRPYAYTRSRADRDTTYDALWRWDGPVVLMINERSYSDGEIFPWGFKALGLGRIVGMPTFGAVIGTNDVRLIDGTGFRVPGTGWYRPDGRNLENDPVTPDVEVPDVPEEDLRGRDAQLEAAVEECLRMLAAGEGK